MKPSQNPPTPIHFIGEEKTKFNLSRTTFAVRTYGIKKKNRLFFTYLPQKLLPPPHTKLKYLVPVVYFPKNVGCYRQEHCVRAARMDATVFSQLSFSRQRTVRVRKIRTFHIFGKLSLSSFSTMDIFFLLLCTGILVLVYRVIFYFIYVNSTLRPSRRTTTST